MKKCDGFVETDLSETIFHDTLQICEEVCEEVNQGNHSHSFPTSIAGKVEYPNPVSPAININVTKLRKTGINEVVGICIKLLLRRVFKTNLPVFEEAFAKDLREAIWKVLNLHASYLHMKKEK